MATATTNKLPERDLTLQEAAEYCAVSDATMRSWIKTGLVPSYRVGPQGRFRLVLADLRRAVEHRP